MVAQWLASEPVECLARVRVSTHAVFLDLQNVAERTTRVQISLKRHFVSRCRVVWRGLGGASISRHFEIQVLYCVEGRGIKYHEMFRDLLAVVSMHILEPQSRTFPLYMTVWQLHPILYLEKSRDIWDSVTYEKNLRT